MVTLETTEGAAKARADTAAHLPPPPLCLRHAALFLDMDGVLAPLAPTPDDVVADPRRTASLKSLAERLSGRVAILSGRTIKEIDRIADDDARERLWAARKALSPALRNLAPGKINEDVVVPVSRIPALVAGVQKLSQEYALPIVCFGHAGNGNLHVNLMYDPADAAQNARAQAAMAAVFALTLSLGGTLSGEHGIGLAKRDFMVQAIDAPTLATMRAIKAAFDPDGILNPGKLLPP